MKRLLAAVIMLTLGVALASTIYWADKDAGVTPDTFLYNAAATIGMVVAGLLFYFAPTFVANIYRHKNLPALVTFNFFLGWSGIGWVLALVWALIKEQHDITSEGRSN